MSVDSEGSTGNPTNFGTAGSVTTGTGPDAVALDAPAHKVFVANSGSTLTVIPTTTCNQSTTSGCSSPTQVASGGHLNAPAALAVSGSTLYVGNGNGTVAVYNAGTNTWVATVNLPSGSVPTALAVDPTNGFVYVADGTNNRVEYFNATTCNASTTVRMLVDAQHRLGRQRPGCPGRRERPRRPLRGQRGEWGRDLGRQLEHPRGAHDHLRRASPATAPAWSSPSACPRTATRSLPS